MGLRWIGRDRRGWHERERRDAGGGRRDERPAAPGALVRRADASGRLVQRCVRTLIVRITLTAEATLWRACLPRGMAARLNAVPEELRAPKHTSQVAFEALSPLTPYNCLPPGLERRARIALARLGAGGGVVVGSAMLVLRGRETERLTAWAEAAAQAPRRAAIAAAIVAARGLKRVVWEVRRQTREPRNDPIHGVEGHKSESRNNPIRGTGDQTRESRNNPIRGGDGQTRESRNNPIRGVVVRAQGAGAPLDVWVGVPAGQCSGETVGWAPGSPGFDETVAREVMKRRLRADVGLCGNDPIRGQAAVADARGEALVAPGDAAVGLDAGPGAQRHDAGTGLGAKRG